MLSGGPLCERCDRWTADCLCTTDPLEVRRIARIRRAEHVAAVHRARAHDAAGAAGTDAGTAATGR